MSYSRGSSPSLYESDDELLCGFPINDDGSVDQRYRYPRVLRKSDGKPDRRFSPFYCRSPSIRSPSIRRPSIRRPSIPRPYIIDSKGGIVGGEIDERRQRAIMEYTIDENGNKVQRVVNPNDLTPEEREEYQKQNDAFQKFQLHLWETEYAPQIRKMQEEWQKNKIAEIQEKETKKINELTNNPDYSDQEKREILIHYQTELVDKYEKELNEFSTTGELQKYITELKNDFNAEVKKFKIEQRNQWEQRQKQ